MALRRGAIIRVGNKRYLVTHKNFHFMDSHVDIDVAYLGLVPGTTDEPITTMAWWGALYDETITIEVNNDGN